MPIKRSEANFLEHEEINALLEAVTGSGRLEDSVIIHIGLFAGLRRGEIFALSWPDVESWGTGGGGRLRIRRSVYRGVVTTPKTMSSERTVDVPQRVLDLLAELRATRPPRDQGFIFPRMTTGLPVDPQNWCRRRFAKICKHAGLPETTGIHSLRHSYASLLLRQGEGLKYVSQQLGHASIQITCDIYGHVMQSQSTEAMERLNGTIPEPPSSIDSATSA